MSAPGSQGDGITMAAAHGATITGHDTGLLIPSASIANGTIESKASRFIAQSVA